jgi:hypothetical protein
MRIAEYEKSLNLFSDSASPRFSKFRDPQSASEIPFHGLDLAVLPLATKIASNSRVSRRMFSIKLFSVRLASKRQFQPIFCFRRFLFAKG